MEQQLGTVDLERSEEHEKGDAHPGESGILVDEVRDPGKRQHCELPIRACCREVKIPNQYGGVILWCLFMYRIDS